MGDEGFRSAMPATIGERTAEAFPIDACDTHLGTRRGIRRTNERDDAAGDEAGSQSMSDDGSPQRERTFLTPHRSAEQTKNMPDDRAKTTDAAVVWTLGSMIDRGYGIMAYCHVCHHHVDLDLAALGVRFGREISLPEMRRRLRCSACGGRAVGTYLEAPGRPRH